MEALERAIAWLCRHVVVLSAFIRKRDPDTGEATDILEYSCASCFVMSFHGEWCLVTAGHVLLELNQRLKETPGDVQQIRLIDRLGDKAEFHDAVPFPYDPADVEAIDDEEMGLDFGFIVLSPLFRDLLKRNGVEPVSEVNWVHRVDEEFEYDDYLLVGVPSEEVHTTESPESVKGGFSVATVPLRNISEVPANVRTDTGFPRFFARIHTAEPESAKGLSGAPILGFADRGGGNAYWVVAVQSRWDRKTRTVIGCPTRIFAPMIYALIGARIKAAKMDTER